MSIVSWCNTCLVYLNSKDHFLVMIKLLELLALVSGSTSFCDDAAIFSVVFVCVSLTNDPFSPLVILRSFFTVDPASCAHLSCLVSLNDAACFGGGGGVDGRGSIEKLVMDRIDGNGDGHSHGHSGDARKRWQRHWASL